MRRALTIILFAMFTGPVAAQEPNCALRIGSVNLELGEAVDAQIVCLNTDAPEPPELTSPPGLEVELVNNTPSRSVQTKIINGRHSSRTEYKYSLQIIAKKAGRFRLGPLQIKAGDTNYATAPVTVTVKKPDPDSEPRGDKLVFAEIEVDRESVYVTENVEATLTIGIRQVVLGGRRYQINLFRNVLDVRGSQLGEFPGGRERSSEQILTDSKGQRHRYDVLRITRSFTADKAGTLEIGPIFLSAQYPTDIDRNIWGQYQIRRSRKVTERVEAISIEVKSPPRAGRPDDFNGAVGWYRMDVEAVPKNLPLGKPVTLTISIRGAPLDGLAGPNLAVNAELASRFEFVKSELVGEIERDARVYRRAIFPKQAGEQTIPPITWSYFDVRREKYVTLQSDPIEIVVDPPESGSESFDGGLAEAAQRENTQLKLVTGGLESNYTDVDLVLADQGFAVTTGWQAAIAAPPVAWLTVFLLTRRREKLRQDSSYARRRKARRNAEGLIRSALHNGNQDAGLETMGEALQRYLADRFNLPPGEITPADADEVLTKEGIRNDVRDEVVSFLRTVNAARYAGGADESPSPRTAANELRQWMRVMEKSR